MSEDLISLLRKCRVVIPIIQRDYAQGRLVGKVPAIRERFLNAIFSALTSNEEVLELDFIYGHVKENDADGQDFIPLDGQQRLTTLFLLHWYVAAVEGELDANKELLLQFTYETRHSTRVFCEKLVDFIPGEFDQSIRSTIENQSWFFSSWVNDPSVMSMLVMLDEIQEKYTSEVDVPLWPKLSSDTPPITFHLLPMSGLGLPDDLYIKMNSRGKQLTSFEYFKAQFSELLPDEQAKSFSENVDKEWSNLFWSSLSNISEDDKAGFVDAGFLRFFTYIVDVLSYINSTPVEHSFDEVGNYEQIFSSENNISFLFSCLDELSRLEDVEGYFSEIFYLDEPDFDVNKVRLVSKRRSINLFSKCAWRYSSKTFQNPFRIGEQLLLYACILNLTLTEEIDDFPRKIRILRNLIAKSEDELRNENMPNLIAAVEQLMIDGQLPENSRFNPNQIKEEAEKAAYVGEYPDSRELLYKLEDHDLLQGGISVVGLDAPFPERAEKFLEVFRPDSVDDDNNCALLSFGDYGKQYGKKRRYGVKAGIWRDIFTMVRGESFHSMFKFLRNGDR